MSDEEEFDRLMRSSAEFAATARDRMQRWTRLQSLDGRITVHCPITHISGILRQRVTAEQAENYGETSGEDHIILVMTPVANLIVARFGPDQEEEAENYVFDFLATRGLDKDVTY